VSSDLVVCVDFGSTFTKAALVDTSAAELLATAAHRTTLGTDLVDGYAACLDTLATTHPGARTAAARACSSAGGGLRIAVVGQEELVTAEAGRRVALSSGGIVAGVLSHPHPDDAWDRLAAEVRPDVVLLTGGTDGGNAAPLLASAAELAAGRWRGPVVVAGNVACRDEAAATLAAAGLPVVPADNVLPRIGVLAPDSARRAVREVFLAHVIGGKHLSRDDAFVAMVRGATPDVVLTGVEVLAAAAGLPHGVAVVDVGGATTDVHSVVRLDAETAGLGRDVVAATPVSRTVEGDLGMRWSATSTATAAVEAGLAAPDLLPAAAARTADPGFLPATTEEAADEERLAAAAVALAVRRHAGRARVVVSPEGRVVERTGKDLRDVDLLVGSGGVLRAADDRTASRIMAAATGESAEGWQQPRAPRVVVDRDHVLAAVGLLADDHPDAATALARTLL
jgi:uncharacterized protein (TIGR01319 family)